MALLVLCDPSFRNNVWCDKKLRGIADEAARRRTSVKVFTNIDAFEAAAAKLGGDSSVFVLFDGINYIQTVGEVLAGLSAHPILLCNRLDIRLPFRFSQVSTDVEASMCAVADYLRNCGKVRAAMVGVNNNSWGDCCRAQLFERYFLSEERRVFYASGNMESCFEEFLQVRNDFDTVIMPNDHLAICFIEYLKAKNVYSPELFVISYGDTVMARLYSRGITSVTTNHYLCGKAAAEAHFNRLKYGWSNVSISVESKLVVRGSTQNIPYVASKNPPGAVDASPIVEPKLFHIPTNPIGRLDRFLATSDLTDLKLIYCILCGYSYEKMGEFCFLSIEAVKYRVRKMRKALQGDSKADVSELISRYIHKENLLSAIEELENEGRKVF